MIVMMMPTCIWYLSELLEHGGVYINRTHYVATLELIFCMQSYFRFNRSITQSTLISFWSEIAIKFNYSRQLLVLLLISCSHFWLVTLLFLN